MRWSSSERGQIDAFQQHLAAAGRFDAAENVQQRALARARRAHDGHEFAARDLQVHAPQRFHARLAGNGLFESSLASKIINCSFPLGGLAGREVVTLLLDQPPSPVPVVTAVLLGVYCSRIDSKVEFRPSGGTGMRADFAVGYSGWVDIGRTETVLDRIRHPDFGL